MKSSFTKLVNIHTVVIVTLLCFVVFFQKKHDDLGPPFTTRLKEVRRNLLPEQILPYISFGFRNIITDYYWISSIQDLVAWNGKEGYFIGYFKNISTLDPKFEYPYLFSILTIPQKDRKNLKNVTILDEIAHISQKGMEAIPTSWQIPFYLGTQYYLFTKAYFPAEDYLKIAAGRPGAPDGVYLLYSTFVGKGLLTTEQKQGLAVKLIKTIYNNTDNEVIKELAGKGIQEQAIAQLLEKGILAYKEKYKKYPKDVNEMINDNLIKLPQELLDNFNIAINQKDGSFRITAKEEEN